MEGMQEARTVGMNIKLERTLTEEANRIATRSGEKQETPTKRMMVEIRAMLDTIRKQYGVLTRTRARPRKTCRQRTPRMRKWFTSRPVTGKVGSLKERIFSLSVTDSNVLHSARHIYPGDDAA
jgi:hypothetical protein